MTRTARFRIGQIVRHRIYPFRGIVFDIDPVFDNAEAWWLAIPEEMFGELKDGIYAAGKRKAH